jgi:DNA-binding transcriptional regulator LsrR (DeoR family)
MDQHTRLLVKVSRLYFERDMKQQEIADTLAISQARVSRLIKEAKERGIVRSVVVVPTGVHAELEDQLEAKLSLTQAVVVDTDDARSVEQALGTATADYLTSTVTGDAVIGVSTWSSSLISALQSMRPASKHMARLVIQMFGGVGNPDVQYEATRLTSDLARVLGAEPQFVPAPAVVGSESTARALEEDPDVRAVIEQWSQISVSLVGIGALEPSPLLARSGNAVTDKEMRELRSHGAVGDVCLRFFDESGEPIESSFDRRVVGMSPAAIRAVPRRIGVAGGASKVDAIRAAGLGGWISVLITDVETARALTQ